MNTEKLFEIYPWYRQHQHAVDTAANYLDIEVEQVLMGLNKKFNPQIQSSKIETPEAA